MANAVRKTCTRIVIAGHQCRPPSAPKTSSRCVLRHPTSSGRLQNENEHKLRSANGESYGRLVASGQQPAVSWFRLRVAEPDNSSYEPSRCQNASNQVGRPSAEQLQHVFNVLSESLPQLFKRKFDFSVFHPKVVFEDNIRGTKSVGLEYLMLTMTLVRFFIVLKYAYVQFDVLKMTKHPEDETIKVRWRLKGVSGLKVFYKFWKMQFWNAEQFIQDHEETWHDGFSVFHLGSDGLVHKLITDKVQPDNDSVLENECPLPTKLALFSGLSPQQLNILDCLMSNESKLVNELLTITVR